MKPSYPHLTPADRDVIALARRNWLRDVFVTPRGASQYRQFFKLSRAGILSDRGLGVDEHDHARYVRVYELTPVGWRISCHLAGERVTAKPKSTFPFNPFHKRPTRRSKAART